MRSRTARLSLCALAWIALGVAAAYVLHTQSQIAERRASLRAFEVSARDAADALHDVQAGQHAYVAAGQDAREWMTKVTTYLRTATSAVDTLKSTARSQAAATSLQDATAAITEVNAIDRRLRGQIGQGDLHQAAESVYSESEDTTSSAVADVESAIVSERQLADTFEAGQRRAQAITLVGVAVVVAVVVALLGLLLSEEAGATSARGDRERSRGLAPGQDPSLDGALEDPKGEYPLAAEQATELLTKVSGLCTEFGRAQSADQLRSLLRESADLMQARGLIVWLGDGAGSDLRPVLAHGYSEATLARLSRVARHADNAAAAAYRTSEVQIVKSREGGARGAIVAPLLSTDGCIGALTAELRDLGDESSVAARSVAVVVASQLAGALAATADVATASDAQPNAAAG
ncbi:MAG: hypothetical protein ABMA15_02745 [Vicinamibacterales bacterium]